MRSTQFADLVKSSDETSQNKMTMRLCHFFIFTTLLFSNRFPVVQAFFAAHKNSRQPKGFSGFHTTSSVLQQRTLPHHATKICHSNICSKLQNNNQGVQVRDWREGEEVKILDLLRSAEAEAGGFDPEGPLMIDCGNTAAIKESYDSEDGGCLLVATTDDSDTILGVGALIIGTPITYTTSGASRSFPDKVTGAARRICAMPTMNDQTTISGVQKSIILQCLLTEIEKRATQGGATELIILAYPTTTSHRPTSSLLEERGYFELPANLNGVNAEQYCKNLDSSEPTAERMNSVTKRNVSATSTTEESRAVDIVMGASFVSILLVAFLGVANMMGLELLPSSDNRGIGTPLSTQELQRLKQDEQLQRTDIDGHKQSMNEGDRQWEDLNAEEQREEVALMKIIQGQDFRLQ